MFDRFSLDFIEFKNSEINELIKMFNEIPDNDPYKNEHYKNLRNIYEFLMENQEEYKPKFRLLNNLKSGQIQLSLLGKTATHLQDLYSRAYIARRGINSLRGKIAEQAKAQSNMIASVAKGSFIIKIENIGDKEINTQMDFTEDEEYKYALIDELMESINNIENTENVEHYYEKFGNYSLQSTKNLLKDLSDEEVEFEYINKKENVINVFSNEKVKEIYKLIDGVDISENTSTQRVSGVLTGVNNDNSKLYFRDEMNNKIAVNVIDDSLKQYNLTTNNLYELDVNVITINHFGKTKIVNEIETVSNTSLTIR